MCHHIKIKHLAKQAQEVFESQLLIASYKDYWRIVI